MEVDDNQQLKKDPTSKEPSAMTAFLQRNKKIPQAHHIKEEVPHEIHQLEVTRDQAKFLNSLTSKQCVDITHCLCTFDSRIGVMPEERFVIFPSNDLEQAVKRNAKMGYGTTVDDVQIAWCAYSREMVCSTKFLKGVPNEEDDSSKWGKMYDAITTYFQNDIVSGLKVAVDGDMQQKWSVTFVDGQMDDNEVWHEAHYVIGVIENSTSSSNSASSSKQ